MIERYLLRYFLAVIDQGNFSSAAAQCNVSQPTLSVGIAKLERLLGRPLFNRNNRRVEITELGTHLAAHARKIEFQFNMFERSMNDVPSYETLRLGVLTTIPTVVVGNFIREMLAASTGKRIELLEGRERDLQQLLKRGRIDVAITIVRDDLRLKGEIVQNEGYSLAIPENHPFADAGIVSAESLATSHMIIRRNCEVLSETSRYFTSRGVRPFIAARTTSDERALQLVASGLGVTVVPDSFTASGVALAKLAGFDIRRDLGLLYAPHSAENIVPIGSGLEMLKLRMRSAITRLLVQSIPSPKHTH